MILYICPNHRMYNSRVNPNVNCGLWVIMMFQCRFMDCNKRCFSGEDVHSKGDCMCGGTLYFLLSFAVNLKLL